MKSSTNFVLALAVAGSFLYPQAYAADTFKSISNLSLDQLRNLKVTSVSKKEERAFDAAAAIYVITDKDIKSSGVTSIPEALRMVPGLEVARVNSHSWAITSRGFAGGFANKLLVLIDGRSVYTPLFAGVIWDVQDTMMDDIKRIEVIRGPGGTLWGANAVNGIINIITKSASETQGGLARITYGTGHIGHEESARYGAKTKNNIYYRTYAKYFDRGHTDKLNGSSNNDSWSTFRTGFRTDWGNGGTDNITVQGDWYASDKNGLQTPIALTSQEVVHSDNGGGGNIMAKWNHEHENNSESLFQIYYDNIRRDSLLLEQSRDTIDLDYQHTWDWNDRNELVWGGGYRFFKTSLEGSTQFTFSPEERYDKLYSAFIQNKYALLPNELFFTLGSKFEHNSFSGFEYQPSARLTWLPNAENTVWAAVSRAVRSPSIGNADSNLIIGLSGFGGFQRAVGNRQYGSEELVAYEAGYRTRINKDLSVDIATFYNDYDNLLSLEPVSVSGTDLLIPIANKGEARTYGFEISTTYNATDNWRLIGSYNLLQMDLDIDTLGSENDDGKSPKNQFKLRSQWNITDNVELDNSIYYVDNLNKINIPGYVKLDTRVGWKPHKGLELSLVGQNLLDDKHQEFSAPLHSSASEIGRVVYATAAIKF